MIANNDPPGPIGSRSTGEEKQGIQGDSSLTTFASFNHQVDDDVEENRMLKGGAERVEEQPRPDDEARLSPTFQALFLIYLAVLIAVPAYWVASPKALLAKPFMANSTNSTVTATMHATPCSAQEHFTFHEYSFGYRLERLQNKSEAVQGRQVDVLAREDGADEYQIVHDENGCSVLPQSKQDVHNCMSDRWVMITGASDPGTLTFSMIKFLIERGAGISGALYFDQIEGPPINGKKDAQWFWQTQEIGLWLNNTVYGKSDALACTSPESCHELSLNDNVLKTSLGLVTRLYSLRAYDTVARLKELKASGVSAKRPVPDIIFLIGTWEGYSISTDNKGWAKDERGEGKNLLDLYKSDMIEMLDYLADEWPQVKHIHLSNVWLYYMEVDKEWFETASPNSSRWPKVLPFQQKLKGSKATSELKVDGHHSVRSAVPIMNALLDGLCPNETPVSESMGSFAFLPQCFQQKMGSSYDTTPGYAAVCNASRIESYTINEKPSQNQTQVVHDDVQYPTMARLLKSEPDPRSWPTALTWYVVFFALFCVIALSVGAMRFFECSPSNCWEYLKNYDLAKFPLKSSDERASGPTTVTEMPPSKKKKLQALGTARFIASVHIVCGHLYAMGNGAIPSWYTSGWGFTWVPFFMMLSGFVLTYARLNSSNPSKREPRLGFLIKRLRGIYPLYLCGLLCRMAQRSLLDGKVFSLGTPYQVFLSLTLTQAWDPNQVTRVLNAHCWFLSCIVPYWFVHQDAYAVMRKAKTSTLWGIATLVFLIPVLGFWLIPDALGVPYNWYAGPKQKVIGNPSFTTSTLVNFLKFHPLFYFHIYLFGIVVGVLWHRREEAPVLVQWFFRNGALIGVVGLFGIFVLSGLEFFSIPGYKLSCRIGTLAPLQGLYLIGLAIQKDPVARFFSLRMLAPLENLSYPQYIFQFIAYFGWPRGGYAIDFWLWLLTLSMFGYSWVQKPLKLAGNSREKQCFGIIGMVVLLPVFVASAAAALSAAEKESPVSPQVAPRSPRYKQSFSGSPKSFNLDADISLSNLFNHTNTPALLLINPALMYNSADNSILVAFRNHSFQVIKSSIEEEEDDIKMAYSVNRVWKSEILMAKLDPATYEPLEPLHNPFENTAQSWTPCSSTNLPFHPSPADNTLNRDVVTGIEDPRFVWPSSLQSNPNQLLLTTNMFYPVHKNQLNHGHCNIGRRMMIADIGKQNKTDIINVLLNSPLGATLERTATEKNWLAFFDANNNGTKEELKFIVTVIPLKVVRAIDWEASLGNEATKSASRAHHNNFVRTEQEHFEFSQEQKDYVNRLNLENTRLHGGCNPIRYQRKKDNKSVMLSCFHLLSEDGRYDNFLFEFAFSQEKQVYQLGRISKKLDLVERAIVADTGALRPLAFASAITPLPNGFAIGYGSSNLESRMLVLSRNRIEELFNIE